MEGCGGREELFVVEKMVIIHRLDILCAQSAAHFLEFGFVTDSWTAIRGVNPKSQLSRPTRPRPLKEGPYPWVRVWMTHLCRRYM